MFGVGRDERVVEMLCETNGLESQKSRYVRSKTSGQHAILHRFSTTAPLWISRSLQSCHADRDRRGRLR